MNYDAADVPEDALFAWIRDSWESLESAGDYEIERGWRADAFLRLWGICIQTIRHSRAYVVLVDAGFEREAFANARAALEHSITAQWAFHRIDGLGRLAVEMTRKEKEYMGQMASWLQDSALAERAAQIEEVEGAGMPKFMDVLRAVDDDGFLETAYSTLSLPNHVRPGSQTEYLHVNGDALLLRYEPHHLLRYPGTHAAAMAVMFALAIIVELANDSDAMARLDRVSDELALPPTLWGNLPERERRPNASAGTPWAAK